MAKILVVDDSAVMRKTISDALLDKGYTVLQAENGLEASLQADEHFNIDLIILDWELPDTNGPEVFKKIINDYKKINKKVPKVLFFTGLDSIERREKVLELGAVDFISKDLSVAQVLITVNKILMPKETVNNRGILIVEDSAVYLKFYKETLEDLNLKIFKALSAEEGLEIFKEFHHEIDLMVVDNELPGMNGMDFVRLVREKLGFRRIPIIFSTSKAHNRNAILEVLGAGATDFFEKPVIKEEFVSRVETHLTNINLSDILKKNLKNLHIINVFKNQYTSQICHHSREMLENLFGYTELLEELSMDDEAKGYLANMKESLHLLLGNIVELKSSEDNLFARDIEITKFDFRETADSIVDDMAGRMEEKKIDLLMEYKEDDKSYSVISKRNLETVLNTCVSYLIDNGENISQIKVKFLKDGPTRMDIFIHDNGKAVDINTLYEINYFSKEDEKHHNPLLKVKEILTNHLSRLEMKSNEDGNHIKISVPIIGMKSTSWSY